MWGPLVGEDEQVALFTLRPAGQCRSHHLSPLRCRTETQCMASCVGFGGRPGWPRFGPGAHPCGLPWTGGNEARLWGASSGKAPASGSAGLWLSDPVLHSNQHGHSHAYRNTAANLHGNSHPNGHTYRDGNSHTYRDGVSHSRDTYSYTDAAPPGCTDSRLCCASPARTGRWSGVRWRGREDRLAMGVSRGAGRRRMVFGKPALFAGWSTSV